MDTSKLCQSDFTQAPEVLDTVYMVVPICKFILAMLDSIMFLITKIRQSVIGLKAVGVNNRSRVGFALDNGQQLACGAVFDDLGINLIAPFEHPENRYFTFGSASSNPTNPSHTEVAFIEFDLPILKWTLGLAKLGDPNPDFVKSAVYSEPVYANIFGYF